MKTRKELYLEAARVAEMIEGTDLTMGECWMCCGLIIGRCILVDFSRDPEKYEACLALIEGKTVFKGDYVYNKRGDYIKVTCGIDTLGASWNPPKPKTMMVELLIEDVEFWHSMDSYYDPKKYMQASENFKESCAKALEELKS